MNTLKALTINGLNASQTKNFKLDFDIVSTNFTNSELCIKYGVNQSKISGRKASLVTRGHLAKSCNKPSSISVSTNTKGYKRITVEVKNEVIRLFNEQTLNKDIAKRLNISKKTVGRIKSAMKNSCMTTPKKVVTKTVNTNVSVNPYNNVKGVNKEIARNKMAKYIVDSNVEGTIPTLCHIDATIEKKILAHNENYNFIGIERDLETFNAMKKTIKNENLPIKAYRGDFSDKIYGAKENQFAAILGDYCGELPTFASEVEYAVSNKIVKVGGIMALTFGKPIRSKCLKSDSIFKLGAFITNDNENVIRSQSDKAIEGYFQRLIGFDFDLVEIFNYFDDKGKGKGYPMVLVILKRIR